MRMLARSARRYSFSPSFATALRRGERGGDTDVAFLASSPVTGHREEERRGEKIVRFPLSFGSSLPRGSLFPLPRRRRNL